MQYGICVHRCENELEKCQNSGRERLPEGAAVSWISVTAFILFRIGLANKGQMTLDFGTSRPNSEKRAPRRKLLPHST